ncbi:D-alanine--D-alanine ligase B (D-alanylalanine synthetaseB) (D-Ala-D-Ala ligase B) [Streptococcus pneumoniae]|nr:D-alanine--D-alanine ligase B (D-alanylalanine synthetaseB) (D-Ala-D-Ala ligase B) [Streptococcus pneumoniae]CJH54641.1 D-alanine--D-alanine ligase B (D-alanylalanine synthetaseB) (D-Ala-D-Ala ligase B) [Streptococcus pneumoniae]CJK00460.1 D-alanine--D-alanine ligase B (D-alanylalanine synthetaseB) (D-Ala-D-Ala ligase B) [Streptococcus pneumoniae]
MMVKDGIPYVMEINTLPGMTQSSLLPKSAEAAGISYSKLLDMIIETSLKVRKEEGF